MFKINMTTERLLQIEEEYINIDDESWVDLTSSQTPDRITPLPFAGSAHNGDMQRLLWEAQRESNQSSARVSRASSRRDSPKSPPNSPNTELSNGDEIKDIYINYNREDIPLENSTDWIWDWSSRPDQLPPKQWKFQHPTKSRLSIRHSKAVKSGLFSTEVLSVMILTNIFSVIIGAGIGIYIGKRMVSTFALD